jgi:glycerate-2-kinase
MTDLADTAQRVTRAWAEALASFDLGSRVRAALATAGGAPPLRAFAIGKAALAMMEGAASVGFAYAEAIVVVPEGEIDAHGVQSAALAGARVLIAPHPLPDPRSEDAGRALLALAERAARDGGTIHAMISGGASALACVPCAGLDIETAARMTHTLLASGADVRAINMVRRHLSSVHGGGVLRACGPAAVHTVVVSDVLGGSVFDVGSGPTVVDPTTVEEAREVLRRFAPAFAGVPLVETLKSAAHLRGGATVIADPAMFAAHVRAFLTRAGFDVVPENRDGPASPTTDARHAVHATGGTEATKGQQGTHAPDRTRPADRTRGDEREAKERERALGGRRADRTQSADRTHRAHRTEATPAGGPGRRRSSHPARAEGVSLEALADAIVDEASRLARGQATTRAAEPALAVPRNAGRGGRATHLAAIIAGRLPPDVVCLVGASDGVDGGSLTGGAVVTRETARALGPTLARSIEAFDAAACLREVAATLPGKPTGLNFADVVVLARRAGVLPG